MQRWIDFCWSCAREPVLTCAGTRNIIRNVQWRTQLPQDLQLTDVGYKPNGSKISQLKKYYKNEESTIKALEDWEVIREKGNYNSVGITTHAHQKKGFTKQGFCIQAYTITQINKQQEVDIFYRTTEVVKKFAADLVFFRDEIIPIFELDNPVVNFHFANVTIHPMHMIQLAPLDKGFFENLDEMKTIDFRFYRSVIKWSHDSLEKMYTSKYLTQQRIGQSIKENSKPNQFKRIEKKVNERYENLPEFQ